LELITVIDILPHWRRMTVFPSLSYSSVGFVYCHSPTLLLQDSVTECSSLAVKYDIGLCCSKGAQVGKLGNLVLLRTFIKMRHMRNENLFHLSDQGYCFTK
jgi:hypothetical protein